MGPTGPTQLEPILVLVRRARARIRIQRMLEAACTALIPASGLALVGTHLTIAGATGGVAILVAAGALVVGALAVVAARAIPDEEVAGHLDVACELRDRLRTALVFARSLPAAMDDRETIAFMRAAIRDGARIAPHADVVRATPFREPRYARTAALCSVVAAALACVSLPDLRRGTMSVPLPVDEPAAQADEVEPGEPDWDRVGYPLDEVDEVIRTAEELQMKSLQEHGEELRALLEAFARGEVTKEYLLERLTAAERRLAEQLAEPASASLPTGVKERLADVHEAVARLEPPRAKGDRPDKKKSELDRKPKDRMLTLSRRPRTTGNGGTAPPAPPQPPGKPRRPPGTPGPGGVRPGPTSGPGGAIVKNGPVTNGPLGSGPEGKTATPGGRNPGSTDGGREFGRGTSELTLTPPTGPRGDGTSVVHVKSKTEGASSTRTTIVAAASQGFAGTPYRDVFARYRRIVEDTMHGEKLPSSYRYFVKRYFWSIRPETQPE